MAPLWYNASSRWTRPSTRIAKSGATHDASGMNLHLSRQVLSPLNELSGRPCMSRRRASEATPLCKSFLFGGFECSCHRTSPGNRLDMVEASGHEGLALGDYQRLRHQGIRTAREGVRWHLVETRGGRYNFSSVVPIVRAAHATNTQVIWDLCHFGWPDHLNVFSAGFVRSFARLARAFLRVLTAETDQRPIIAPINEISFLAWAGGETGSFNPFAVGRSDDLKQQLVRATIEAIEAIWGVAPEARIVHTDPAINVVAGGEDPTCVSMANAARGAQYHAWDMLAGLRAPHLGGQAKYLDVIGLNYYPHNQWVYDGARLTRSDPQCLPLSHLIRDNHDRYCRPVLLAETGTEGEGRAKWLRYVACEVRKAMRYGVRVEGVCWYPIVNHPGWDDGRRCENGLWDYPDASGHRPIHTPLALELRRQQRQFHLFLRRFRRANNRMAGGDRALD